MSPSSSSSSKLSQLVAAIKSSDPVRTRALCDDITFDINDAVECDSDGEDDFPLQVALGKRKKAAVFFFFFGRSARTSRRRCFLSLFTYRRTRKGGKRTRRAKIKSLTDDDGVASHYCV